MPERIFFMLTRAREQSMRCTSCCVLISKLKTPTGFGSSRLRATCSLQGESHHVQTAALHQLGKGARQRLGVVVLLAGLAATIPLLIGAGVRVNRELGEGRRTRRRLETIRHDSGFAEDGEFY